METSYRSRFRLGQRAVSLAYGGAGLGGGHLAAKDDWGEYSASNISGSPYHMKLKSWTEGSPGQQDLQTSVGAVIQPPKLTVKKIVTNDNGGLKGHDEFTINVTGTEPTPNRLFGSLTGEYEVALVAGDYSVLEEEEPGYAAS